jgi:hypothetical protein
LNFELVQGVFSINSEISIRRLIEHKQERIRTGFIPVRTDQDNILIALGVFSDHGTLDEGAFVRFEGTCVGEVIGTTVPETN